MNLIKIPEGIIRIQYRNNKKQKIAYCYGLHNYEKIGLYAVSGICLTLVFSLTILVIGIGINFFMGDIFTMKMSYLQFHKIKYKIPFYYILFIFHIQLTVSLKFKNSFSHHLKELLVSYW